MISKVFIATTVTFMLVLLAQQAPEQTRTFLVSNPDAVMLELVPPKAVLDTDQKNSGSYDSNAKVYFQLLATNSSLEPVSVPIISEFYQSRPQLTRDGDLLIYKANVQEILKKQETEAPRDLVQVINLQPNEQRLIGYLHLDTWYGRLRPGHYQLSVKHRFEPGQSWVTSSTITFEVTPLKMSRKE
jgi:hypothetical protein